MIRAVQQFMLGTVTGREKQARQTLEAMAAAGYNGIELCGFMVRPANLAVRLLTSAAGMPVGGGGKLDWAKLTREAGLQVVSLHQDLDTLEKDPDAVLQQAERYGTQTVVITGMYGFDYGSREQVERLADRLNQAGKILAERGGELLYHNHNCELQKPIPGVTAYELLMDRLDENYVNFEFDSYWFAEGGADPLAWMVKLGSRMKLWHINDRGARHTGPAMTPILKTDSMELGDGNLDLDALTRQAKAVGIRAVILESHRNWVDGSPVKSFQRSAQYLNRHF